VFMYEIPTLVPDCHGKLVPLAINFPGSSRELAKRDPPLFPSREDKQRPPMLLVSYNTELGPAGGLLSR